MNEVLKQVKRNLAEELESNKAFICAESLPSVFGVKVALVQLFQNLLQNAIKFRTNIPPHIIIRSQLLEKERCWEFKFIDNGIGIKKEYQEKVFEPFHQLSPGKDNGLGIGLSICQKAVEIHKGHIYFISEPNQGTTFVFTLCDIKTDAQVELVHSDI